MTRLDVSARLQRAMAGALMTVAIGITGMASAETKADISSAAFASPSTSGQFVPTALRSTDREYASIGNAMAWLNSPALTPADLRGKVVLVDFWTYSCINWIRTLPWLRAWQQKYASQGLVVVGVHTPEFEFEKDVDNVRRFVGMGGVDFAVALDSDHAIWRAFGNQYWPAVYLFDAQGRMRHQRFGEGEYERIEQMIQQLLVEAGATGVSREPTAVHGAGVETQADWRNLRTPEIYVGYARAENFVSPGGADFDRSRSYTAPRRLRLNQWALSGDWTVTRQYGSLDRPGGRIAIRFHARDAHLVMGAAAVATGGTAPVRFRVLIDGKPPGADRGLDVDEHGNGMLREPRLYQLVRQTSAIHERQLEIEFVDRGAQLYSFTFG